MKNTTTIILRVMICCVFLYNLGVFSLFKEHKYDISYRYDSKFSGKHNPQAAHDLHLFVQEKVDRAKALGAGYTVELYFTDMDQIKAKEVQLQQVAYSWDLINLCAYRDIGFKAGMGHAIGRENIQQGLDALEKKYPTKAPVSVLNATSPSPNLLGIIGMWLWVLYLKCLPLALLLFLIWIYEESGKIRIRAPFQLAKYVLGYPYYLWRYFRADLEIRRTKKYVTDILHADEREMIRAFVFGKQQIQDLQNTLKKQHRVVYHGYFKLILCTFIFAFMARTCIATTLTSIERDQRTTIYAYTSQYDTDRMDHRTATWTTLVIRCEEAAITIPTKIREYISFAITLLPTSWHKQIDHVPLVTYKFST